jgi:hypothetical protein
MENGLDFGDGFHEEVLGFVGRKHREDNPTGLTERLRKAILRHSICVTLGIGIHLEIQIEEWDTT